jgi:oligoribonuclease
MTGLDTSKDSILELCCLITSADLELLDPAGFSAVIQHSPARLAAMDEWCTTHHGDSGLTARCIASTTTAAEAADALLAYIQRVVPEPRTALLAGNSVHADRAFLALEPWSKVLGHLHYRILDVSSLKEAARRWSSEDVLRKVPAKKGAHRAREDIEESIEEARFYRDAFFRKGS